MQKTDTPWPRRAFITGLAVLAAAPAAFARPRRHPPRLRPATVMVVASLHSLHLSDRNYGYDRLYRVIRDFRPDWVGVEIRPEDMTADTAYLGGWYPREMRELKDDYPGRVFGFDWFGDDLNGRPIPADWRTASAVKTMERDMDSAPELQTPAKQAIKARLDAIQAKQQALLANATPRGLNDGRYDALCVDYYDTLRQYTAGTRFEALSRFYTARDAHLAAGVVAFVKAHPGQRIAIVTGADHHGPVVRYLKDQMKGAVRLETVR